MKMVNFKDIESLIFIIENLLPFILHQQKGDIEKRNFQEICFVLYSYKIKNKKKKTQDSQQVGEKKTRNSKKEYNTNHCQPAFECEQIHLEMLVNGSCP